MQFHNSKNQNALMRAHLTINSTSFFFSECPLHCALHKPYVDIKTIRCFLYEGKNMKLQRLQNKINNPPYRVSYGFYCNVINLHTAWRHKVGIFCLYLHLKIDSFIKYKYNPQDYWHHWAVLSTKQKSHWRAKERV